MAAVFNLNHHASYVHWHFISLSVSNIALIGAMFLVFFLAILARFPRGGVSGAGEVGGAPEAGANDLGGQA